MEVDNTVGAPPALTASAHASGASVPTTAPFAIGPAPQPPNRMYRTKPDGTPLQRFTNEGQDCIVSYYFWSKKRDPTMSLKTISERFARVSGPPRLSLLAADLTNPPLHSTFAPPRTLSIATSSTSTLYATTTPTHCPVISKSQPPQLIQSTSKPNTKTLNTKTQPKRRR